MKSIEIFAKVFTNKILTLKVVNTDNIASIKKQIELLEQISTSEQRLIFMRNELNDQQSIAQYNIQEGSTIICESSVLLITLPGGRIVTFPVGSDDTIDQIKQRITKETGIPKISQRMFYPCCSFRGRQLDDSKTIYDNKIGGNLVHVLQAVQGTQIFVEILESTRTIVNIPVRMSDRVIQIKKKIQQNLTQDIMQYRLFIEDNEMDDNNSLFDYKIKNETVLQLCKDKIIFVQRSSGAKFKVQVKRSDTIIQFKMRINQKIDVPLELQTLKFHNTELNDSKTLADYDIGFGMKVELKTGKRIFVSSLFRIRMVFELQATDTIRTLKQAIKEKIGVPEDHQKIARGGYALGDQWQCFKEDEELKLWICSENHLILNVFVGGTSSIIEAMPTDDIMSVKKKIEKEIGIQVENYSCYFENKQLHNKSKLGNCGISNMSMLELSKIHNDLKKMYIKTHTGKTITLMVVKSSTIEHVKRKYESVEGIPVDQQRLIYAGTVLENARTVESYGLDEHSTLHMTLRLRGC